MRSTGMNVTIIGAGVIGLNCAYYLQKEGHRVTVIDRGDITDGCSFGNMGYVSPSHFKPVILLHRHPYWNITINTIKLKIVVV